MVSRAGLEPYNRTDNTQLTENSKRQNSTIRTIHGFIVQKHVQSLDKSLECFALPYSANWLAHFRLFKLVENLPDGVVIPSVPLDSGPDIAADADFAVTAVNDCAATSVFGPASSLRDRDGSL
jgi:hypothetical protein